jgi:serine/threonine protein kinase
METSLVDRFKLGTRIGSGAFGEVYSGEDMRTHTPVAIKLEPATTSIPQLAVEARIYHCLSGGVVVPTVHFFGTTPSGLERALVMDLLSESLEGHLNAWQSPLSLKSVLMIADQMLTCIEWMHRRHFVHRDIKPENFMLGVGNDRNKVFVIDFGLSTRFEDIRTLQHAPLREGRKLAGTARYASINAMRGIEQSRRDDLESLGYVWLYLLKRHMPWQGLDAGSAQEKLDRILAVKLEVPPEVLCEGLPVEFAQYILMVRSLEYAEEPKYAEYRRLFRELFVREGYVYDEIRRPSPARSTSRICHGILDGPTVRGRQFARASADKIIIPKLTPGWTGPKFKAPFGMPATGLSSMLPMLEHSVSI